MARHIDNEARSHPPAATEGCKKSNNVTDTDDINTTTSPEDQRKKTKINRRRDTTCITPHAASTRAHASRPTNTRTHMETYTAWPQTIEYLLACARSTRPDSMYIQQLYLSTYCTGRPHSMHACSEVLPVSTRSIMAHPSRPADLRREPALERPGPSRDTATPHNE